MVKTYKKKQTRRRQRRNSKRASVRHGRVRRLRKIQRGGADETIDAIVNGIEISGIKTALVSFVEPSDNVTLMVDEITTENVIPTSPVSFTFGNKKIEFFIATPPGNQGLSQRFVYIFLNNNLYGRIMLVINKTKINDSYHESVATAIFNAINKKPDIQQYKTSTTQ